jgi:sensor histidine kinase YesM
MKQLADFDVTQFKMPRPMQHILFWLIVSFIITLMYSVPTNFMVSLRNNFIFMPIQIAYYYAIAGWLIPKYLFPGKYLKFCLLALGVFVLSVVVTRIVGILFVTPYTIRMMHLTEGDYFEASRRPFLVKLFDLQNMINALKGTNLVIGFVLAIKLFKMWYQRKQATLQAELNALKAQVHPHFLFNTLNNLYALSLNQSAKSPQLILNLSNILRYMLYECNTGEVLLSQEITMLQQFISLEKLRYEDRLDINFNIYGDTDGKLIAPLLMLPLVENAFKHGAGEQMGDAWININLYVMRDELKLKISNSKAAGANKGAGKTGNIGLQNLRKRLELIYPITHSLKIMDDNDTFLAVLDLRLNFAPQSPSKINTHEIAYTHS